MKNRFRAEIDTRLSDLTFTREAAVIEKLHARRQVRSIPKRTVVLVLALMLMLCGTAVALTLRYSARFDLERHARGVLSSTYGLSGEMIDLFSSHIEQGEDGWTVHFTPIAWPEQMGEYTVTGGSDGSTRATWSHDGDARSDTPGDLSQGIWGPTELQKLIDLRRENFYEAKYWPNYGDMTLEERAAIDAPLLALAGAGYLIDIAPEEGDIQPEEALALARQGIMNKYGVSAAALESCHTSIAFRLYTADMARQYSFEFAAEKTAFRVKVSSPKGQVTYCRMYAPVEAYPLPEGDLSLYPDAAKEFVAEGAFEALSPEGKAEVYQRFKEAGMSVLLPAGEFITPAPADLDERAAIGLAREGLMAQRSFPVEAFALFRVQTAMLRQEDDRVWQVRFIGETQRGHINWLRDDSLGDYTVTVAADGSVTRCEWSLERLDEEAHDETSFGQARVFSGADLGYVMTLKGKLDEILSRYPPDVYEEDMTLEDRAAMDALMRQAGFSPKVYATMLPAEGEMMEQEAIARAREVLKDEYGVTDQEMDKAVLETSFRMRYDLGDTPVKGWDIVFKGCGPNGADIYTVFLNAVDGVIEEIVHDDAIISNG